MRITIAQNSPSPDGSSRQAEDPEGRQAGRPPCRTADEVRAGDQPKDRRRRSDSRSRRRCCWARIRLSSDMNYRKLRSGFPTSNETPPWSAVEARSGFRSRNAMTLPVWKDANELPPNYQPPPWEELLLDA